MRGGPLRSLCPVPPQVLPISHNNLPTGGYLSRPGAKKQGNSLTELSENAAELTS